MSENNRNVSSGSDDENINLNLVEPDYLSTMEHPFFCVQRHIYDRIRTIGGIEPRRTARTYLTMKNLEFIFYKFLARFAEETGTEVLPENQSMQFFAEYVFETYYGMMDSFDNEPNPTPQQIMDYVSAWNKNTVDWLLLRTMRAYNRQNNYVRRYKDYKYGALRIDPIKINTKKAKRVEANLLQNYAAIGTSLGAPLYPVRDYD